MSSETPAKNAKATTPAKGKPKRTQKPKAGANQATKQPSAKGPMKPKPQEDNESDEEGDSCFICAEPIVTYAVTPCNHRTCHICALRLRALYKTKNCVFCKTEQKTVIFTKDPTKLFEEFTKKDIHSVDKKLDIQFENELIHQDTILSLEYNCPDPKCDVACDGWAQLKKHVNKEHNVLLCDLCIKNKQIFAHEHTLYTAVQLNKHYKHGDKSFNKDDDSGFKGHPECAFCRISFYGDDELFHHCREKHEQCHICVQNGVRHEYYPNYDAMERHFRKDHYLCMYRECLDKKFIVFSSQLDLTSHEVEEHGASGRVELSFDYGNHEPHRHKNKQRQQRSQAPVPQPQQPPAAVPELQPVSSARLSSDDFPSIGGASSSVNRPIPGQPKKQPQSSKLRKPQGFGGLTTDHWPDLRPNSATPSPSSSANTSSQSTNATFPDASQVQRHAQVLEKLSRMLNGPVDVEQFRAVTTAYRNDSIDITGYVNEIIRLCKNDATKTTAVLKDVEALIDSQTKKQEVLHALRNTEAKLPSSVAFDRSTASGPWHFQTHPRHQRQQHKSGRYKIHRQVCFRRMEPCCSCCKHCQGRQQQLQQLAILITT
ncbi:hypothetical protein DM01DRAFT_27307 [Hesseltinella vesiculosa]|uniref:RING-type E3 ubiquitin transferase n=1 Tax=Hesseltinella vesiculosa TaxID=101127 RepID=A0A1X2GMY1_9FUNG|nr:hypothetical protein DM01DRAFT_27307 [Hesseltinella vesiculosa]